ncbi:hypothetical protein AN958_05058 [Leucoagaricus sp. SymC.cos]|nr:hypothetical protein AN958_05058 [Leucoagaricus sp. SymC.cos]
MFPINQEPLGPPPAFTPYEAAWFEVGNGDIVSHDEHLNTDGEALYRFLLTQASQRPPSYRIHCRGTHTETRYRFVTSHDSHHHSHHSSSSSSTRTESYRERVTDFDFYIDVTPQFRSANDDFAPIHWTVADNEPVYRGKMVREAEVPSSSRIALSEGDLPLLSSPSSLHPPTSTQLRRTSRKERKDYSKWIEHRTRKGLPPWTIAPGLLNGQWSQATVLAASSPTSTSPNFPTAHRDVMKSSKTVREWADSYCSSQKLLKEFVYTKLLYGWDIAQLESAIRSTIALAPYQGDIEVTFIPINSNIYIRPSNRLSRMMSNMWLKFVSIILFIFPFIWLFKRFHSRGGGRWEVCGGAYALKRLVPFNGPIPGQSSTSGSGSSNAGSELPSYDDIAGPSTLASSSRPLSPLTTSITSPSFPLPSTSNIPSSNSNSRIIQTPQGPCKLIGQREGEWFRYWEPVILRAVLARYQSSIPLTSHTELYGRYAAPGSVLEGYHDTPPGADTPVSLDGFSNISNAPARPNDGFGRNQSIGGILS